MTRKPAYALPDRLPPVADGCEVAASCLLCPLPTCQYDREQTPRERARAERDARIRQWLAEGETLQEVCRRFGVSYRSALRIKAGSR